MPLQSRRSRKQCRLERMLVETDSPYLAPVPYRGKTNEPGWVRHVAEEIARLRGVPLEQSPKRRRVISFVFSNRQIVI